MGRWSYHPMGSDDALDAKDVFMEDFDREEEYHFERPKEEIRNGLLALSITQLKEMSEREYVKNNKFVIPYQFILYKAFPTNPETKRFLYSCLDSHSCLNSYKECLKYINFFKANFDNVISGKIDLEMDKGLIAAIEESDDGLVNK